MKLSTTRRSHARPARADGWRAAWRSPLAIRLLIIVVILVAWQLSAAMHWVDPLFTSRPTQVATSLWKIVPTSQMVKDIGYTLAEVAIGYSIGVALGVSSGSCSAPRS